MKVREALQLASDHLAHDRFAEAEALYRQVLAASPENATALAGMGRIGLQSGHIAEAAEMLERAVAVHPNDADARAALAEALHRTGRREEAERVFRDLLAADATCFPAVSRFGNALAVAGDLARAEPMLRRATELQPNSYTEHFRLGSLLCFAGKSPEAVAALERAAALCPDDAPTHMALGQAFMYAGDFLRGCREMEWRWKLPGPAYPDLPYPRWDGKVEAGKTLLVVGEEGYGDVIQFAGFLPDLAAAGMNVTLTARPELVGLLQSLRGVRIAEEGTPIAGVDDWLPLLSVPLARGLELGTLPRATSYLAADAAKIAMWKDRLDEGGFHVGLAWSGNPAHPHDASRSIPLPMLAPIIDVPGVQWHSLQITPEAQQAIKTSGLSIRDHTEHLHDFSDTAALVSNLELVISIDSSIAHLAGALGRPTWILLYHPPDGRWMLRRTDTPFYPTARLFRQPRAGEWQSVIDQVRDELKRMVT